MQIRIARTWRGRLINIRVLVRGDLPMDLSRFQKWEETRKKGRFRFIFFRGVIRGGGFIALLSFTIDLVTHLVWGYDIAERSLGLLPSTMIMLLQWVLAGTSTGFLLGFWLWERAEREFLEFSLRTKDQPHSPKS